MIRLFLSVFLLFTLCAESRANDPFALLFGEAGIDASEDSQAGEDDLLVLQLLVRNHLLDEGWAAYQSDNGICIPLQSLTDALGFPIEYTANHAKGWVLSPDQPIDLPLSLDTGFQQSAVGWCAEINIIESLFPVTLDYQSSTLSLVIEPTTVLPLEAKLKRTEARKILELAADPSGRHYREIENPYNWVSWPTIDISLDSMMSRDSETKTTVNIDMSADVLKTSAHLRTLSQRNDFMESTRFTLFRENHAAEELGFLNARRFAVGDISSPSLPLTARSASGRGFIVSNRDLFKPDLFDETVVRGALPVNWEAELYDGETLLGFVTEPDNNGQYVFENVPLRPGYNRLNVKLYGPYGEEEVRTVAQFVGPELCPEGTWKYSFGFIDTSTSAFGDRLVDSDSDQDVSTNTGYGFTSVDYGLSKQYSVRADFRQGEEGSLSTFSLIGSKFGGYGVLRAAMNDDGQSGIQAQFQKSFSDKTSFSLNAVDYGNLETEINGTGDSKIDQTVSGRLDTQLGWWGRSLPIQNELEWEKGEDGEEKLTASTRVAASISRFKWSNTLRFTSFSHADDQYQGNFLVSRSFAGLRVRSSMSYHYDDRFDIDGLSLTAQKKLSSNTRIQGDFNVDMETEETSFNSTLSRSFGPVSFSAQAGITSQSDWKVGLGIAVSLFRDQSQNRYKAARPGLTRSGVIAPRVFDDLNNNGSFDDGDVVMEGTQFIVDRSLRSEEGNAEGITVLDGLTTAKLINAEVKVSSITDPFLQPNESGRSLIVRPGQVLMYDVPLSMRGDAEGTLMLRKNGIQTPVSGVVLEAITEDNRVISTTQTEYDGYFYLDNLPTTALTIRVSEKHMKGLQGVSKPIEIKLSRENPSTLGLSLFIDMLPPKIL